MSKTELDPQCFSLQELLILSFFILSLGDSLKSYSFLRQGQNWQALLPPPAWSWHVYISAATHMHSQTHTFAVKVWKWLCMTTEQPKALQGINNRPNLRQQTQSVGCWGKWGVMFVNMCECVCVWMWGVLVDMNMWLACVCGFLLGWAVSYVCVPACLHWLVWLLFLCVYVWVLTMNPHTSAIQQGCCDLLGPVGFCTVIPRRHLDPRKINN